MNKVIEVLRQEMHCRRGEHSPIAFLPNHCEFCFAKIGTQKSPDTTKKYDTKRDRVQ